MLSHGRLLEEWKRTQVSQTLDSQIFIINNEIPWMSKVNAAPEEAQNSSEKNLKFKVFLLVWCTRRFPHDFFPLGTEWCNRKNVHQYCCRIRKASCETAGKHSVVHFSPTEREKERFPTPKQAKTCSSPKLMRNKKHTNDGKKSQRKLTARRTKKEKYVDKSHVFCAESCRHTTMQQQQQKTRSLDMRYSIENWRNPIKYLLKVNYIQTFYLCSGFSSVVCARHTRTNADWSNTYFWQMAASMRFSPATFASLFIVPVEPTEHSRFIRSPSHVRINLPFRLLAFGRFSSISPIRLHWLQSAWCNIWNDKNDKLCSH